MRKLAEIEPFARYGIRKLDGEFARILVEERVVVTKEEFAWIKYERKDYDHFRSTNDPNNKHKMRQMVRVMLDYEIERQSIAGIFRFSISRFDPRRLEANLKMLRAAGVFDLTSVFEKTEELVWQGKPANWTYVLNTVGAYSVEDIGRFKRLLNTHHSLSIDFVHRLKDLGANIQGLAQCQTLILAISDHDSGTAPISELNLLASAPHSMNIEQISQCIDYLSKPANLPGYLAGLTKHGYGSAAAVLAFQVCYRFVSVENLNCWLAIVGNRGEGQAYEIVAEWVRQAAKGGYWDGYHYLLDAIDMPDLRHLQQAMPIVSLGRGILHFLIERKGLSSVQALRKWYFDARGVLGFQWWGRVDDVYILLLEDAYCRNNFSFVNGNQSCVYEVVRERVTAKLGHRPYAADEAIRAAYDHTFEAQFAIERKTLVPILAGILEKTGGILLKSVIRSAWEAPHMLQDKLDALAPLIDELLSGRGPVSTQLDELEADAVAMLYRTSVDVVRATWSKVVGHETDLAGLKLRNHYSMRWQSAYRRLNTPLERRSLLALAQAAKCAKRFRPYEYESIFDACKHLRAKRLYQNARDPWSLAAHLGVLLAAAHRDSVVAEWVSKSLEITAEMAEEGAQAFERIEQLEKLFSSTLPDALDEHAEGFLQRFNDADAMFFAERLVGGKMLTSSSSGQEQLRDAYKQTRENVLSVCLRWIAREKTKFVKNKAENLTTSLVAVLTKHPAAFFAKQAANLCTRDNTAMWQEARHAHLVVFDQKQRRLAGMALIYFEPIPVLHPSKNSLIIRALNPMDDMLAAHTASSIVDAFFDVAIQIAKDNTLGSVAFPCHSGMHLLSNHPSIERDIAKRFIESSENMTRYRSDSDMLKAADNWRMKPRSVEAAFFAYETGEQKVNTLYSIWTGNKKKMSKLTDEQLVKGRSRFLAGHPDIKMKIEGLTQAEADALGITLDHLRESETMRELQAVAHANGVDSTELFWSCIADTSDELAQMLEHRNRAIKQAIDI